MPRTNDRLIAQTRKLFRREPVGFVVRGKREAAAVAEQQQREHAGFACEPHARLHLPRADPGKILMPLQQHTVQPGAFKPLPQESVLRFQFRRTLQAACFVQRCQVLRHGCSP